MVQSIRGFAGFASISGDKIGRVDQIRILASEVTESFIHQLSWMNLGTWREFRELDGPRPAVASLEPSGWMCSE